MLVLAAISELGHLMGYSSRPKESLEQHLHQGYNLLNSLLAALCFSFLDNAGFSSLHFLCSLAPFIPHSPSFPASVYATFFLISHKVLVIHHLGSSSLFLALLISPYNFLQFCQFLLIIENQGF